MIKKSDCSGCRNNFYNGNNPYGIGECWHFKSAVIVGRWQVHKDTAPPSGPEVRVPNCWSAEGWIMFKEKPVGNPQGGEEMNLFQCNVCGVDGTLRCEGVWCNAMMCPEHSRTHRYQTLCLDCASDQEEMEEDLEHERSRGAAVNPESALDNLDHHDGHPGPVDSIPLDWCGHPECRVWGGHLCKEAF